MHFRVYTGIERLGKFYTVSYRAIAEIDRAMISNHPAGGD
jgi:hypothetical protein